MSNFIDRRLNPKGKSLANRQRFIRRARAEIKEAVQKSLKDRTVSDFAKDQKISIPTKSTKEPRFQLEKCGPGEGGGGGGGGGTPPAGKVSSQMAFFMGS